MQQERQDSVGDVIMLDAAAADSSVAGIRQILRIALAELDMDMAHLSQFVEGAQVFRAVEGDADSFGLNEGEAIQLCDSYCDLMTTGQISQLIPDARNHPLVNSLPVTRDASIGAYVGVPVRLSNGDLFGSFCVLSHEPDPALRDRDVRFMRVLARFIAETVERAQLETRNWQLKIEAAGLQALLVALEARDGYTGEHSAQVVDLAEAVSEALGLDESSLAEAKQVALLHDIGKIGIPDEILRKEGPLDAFEWPKMQEHTVLGYEIMRRIEPLRHLALAVRAEHERWDGSGYPDGLRAESIPVAARICLACDAWHAMTSDRPYRTAMSVPDALAELKAGSGTQFDPKVVEALVALLNGRETSEALRKRKHDKKNLEQLLLFKESYGPDLDDTELSQLSSDIERQVRRLYGDDNGQQGSAPMARPRRG